MQLGSMQDISTLNKQLEKLQKYHRLRSELISLCSSIHSSFDMFIEIVKLFNKQLSQSESKLVFTPNCPQDILSLQKKIKVFNKAAGITLS